MTKKWNNWKLSAINLHRSCTASFSFHCYIIETTFNHLSMMKLKYINSDKALLIYTIDQDNIIKNICWLTTFCYIYIYIYINIFLLPCPTNLSKKHPPFTQTQPTLRPGSCPAYTAGSPVQLKASASHSPPLPTFILAVSVYPERWFTDVTTPHLQLQLPAAVDWYQHFTAPDDEHEWKISIGHRFVHVK